MDLQLDGKVALVTGSSSGIGAEIARTLAREGATVIVHGRSSSSAEQVAQSITREDGNAVVVTGDLATDEGAEQVASAALAATGAVDILINNAGTYENQGWMETTAEEWTEAASAPLTDRAGNASVLTMVRNTQATGKQEKTYALQIAGQERITCFRTVPGNHDIW